MFAGSLKKLEMYLTTSYSEIKKKPLLTRTAKTILRWNAYIKNIRDVQFQLAINHFQVRGKQTYNTYVHMYICICIYTPPVYQFIDNDAKILNANLQTKFVNTSSSSHVIMEMFSHQCKYFSLCLNKFNTEYK